MGVDPWRRPQESGAAAHSRRTRVRLDTDELVVRARLGRIFHDVILSWSGIWIRPRRPSERRSSLYVILRKEIRSVG